MNMPARRVVAALALATAFTGPAAATQDTDISPMLGGSVDLTYGGDVFTAVLREQGVDVGAVTRNAQTTTVDVRFGVGPGIELNLGLPIQLAGSWKYSNVSPMSTCPAAPAPDGCTFGLTYGTALVLGRDSSLAHAWAPADPSRLDPALIPTYRISGLQDLALGLRLAPFSQRYLGRGEPRTGRFNSRATWIIDLGLLIPAGDDFFTTGGGNQGASSGKLGFRMRTALSRRMNISEPYVAFEYVIRRPYETYVLEGDPVASEIDPQDDVRFFAGTELIPFEDYDAGNKFAVDVGLGYHLRTQGVWASGYYLPQVLTEDQVNAAGLNPNDVITFGEPVNIDEQLGVLGRIRLRFDVVGHVRAHLGVALGYYLPSHVEQAYNIRYGRAIGVEYQFGVSGMW